MSMFAVVNEQKRIVAVYCGDRAPVKLALDQRFEDLPDDFDGVVGDWLDEFDEQLRLRPLADRVADGTARDFPSDWTVDAKTGEPRGKTRLEKVLEGTEQLVLTEKIVGGQIMTKTDDELLAEGLITQQEWQARQPQPDPHDVLISELRAQLEQLKSDVEQLKARKP